MPPTRRAPLLLDIRTGQWDAELLDLFRVPASLMPEVRDSASDFGTTVPHLLGGPVRILGIAGDQQAATVGQGCFKPGMAKSTYGTGCFALLNTGDTPVKSRARLLTTIAYQLDGKRTYALEGAIFIAGAGGAMAARRPEADLDRGRDRHACGAAPIRPTRSTWCRPSSASARRGGTRRRAPRCTG